jgi:hypothetical protein
MSFLDKARAAVGDAVDKHGDKIAAGLDKAATLADQKTGGKHSATIAQGAAKAKEALGRLDGRNNR